MKLSRGERSGLWAACAGYVAIVGLWVVVRPTEDDRLLEFVLNVVGFVVALVAFVAIERRLPTVRGHGTEIGFARGVFGLVAAFVWLQVLRPFLPDGPDTSAYNEARSTLPTIALLFSAYVLALMLPAPRLGSWRDRLSRRADKFGHLLDEGSWDDPTSAPDVSRDIHRR